MAFVYYNKPIPTQGLSMPGQRSDGLIFQSFQGFCSPLTNEVRTVPGQFYTIPVEEAFEQYVLPRAQKDFQVVQKDRRFPIQSEFVDKSYMMHAGNDEIYVTAFKTPNKCISDFCKPI